MEKRKCGNLDTAEAYDDRNSERPLDEAIQGISRDKFYNRICYNDTAMWDIKIDYYLTETEDWREGWKQRAVFIVVALLI